MDVQPKQQYSSESSVILPSELKPIARIYTFRISDTDGRENLQAEYLDDALLSMQGKPHPLLWQAFALRMEVRGWKNDNGFHSTTTTYGFADRLTDRQRVEWKQFEQRGRDLHEELSEQGVVKQAKPGEILLMDNYTIHSSKQPTLANTPIRSAFYRLMAVNRMPAQ